MLYIDLPSEPPHDPDGLARSLSVASGDAPWLVQPETLREAWRTIADGIRADLRAGRLNLGDLIDRERMREVVQAAAERVDAEWLRVEWERVDWRDLDEGIALARLADDGGVA
jgi:hypothetical protein